MKGLSLQRAALVAIVLVALLVVVIELQSLGGGSDDGGSSSRGSSSTTARADQPAAGLDGVALADLPPEAQDTIDKIRAGGPFPERQDGTVFQNREGRLPDQPRGYYHEYTVPTPGSADRGPRRIVTAADGTLYWTADHYRTFQQVTGATVAKGS